VSVPQITQAQGTTTYLSNLDQPSSGSLPVGSNSWLAIEIITGGNRAGYSLDSIQLAMTDASGNPSGFTVMLCSNAPISFGPGPVLGTLNGSLSPVSSGIYTYTPASNLTLKPDAYFIVVTAGTAVADGAYGLSLASAPPYNPVSGWVEVGGIFTSSNGSSWPPLPTDGYFQFAINATVVPEPSTLGLLALGGLFLVGHRRKAKAIYEKNNH
jgi:PEP-CTERM motif